MSYDTTAQALATHFEKEIGAKPSVRLLTTKPTPATRFHKAAESRSRGIAFVEFPTSGALQAGLKLHHTELDGKKINVELTAGGGGATDERKKKIQERNERVGEQRKRKRDADGEGEWR
jgi:nucleolar protein 6